MLMMRGCVVSILYAATVAADSHDIRLVFDFATVSYWS